MTVDIRYRDVDGPLEMRIGEEPFTVKIKSNVPHRGHQTWYLDFKATLNNGLEIKLRSNGTNVEYKVTLDGSPLVDAALVLDELSGAVEGLKLGSKQLADLEKKIKKSLKEEK